MHMTPAAAVALDESSIIIGYTVYIDLLRERYSHKELMTTPMKKEVDRCRMTVEEALKGKTVSLVCSGDSGVYGMAGLVFQVAEDMKCLDRVEIEIVPGITAAVSGAAVLGAPLIHDFAVISLSDLLTPYELIEKRLKAAAEGDFVICLYNPSSRKRHDYLRKACDILLQVKSADTVCGTVRNIGREGQESHIMSLSQLRETQVDMFTTVFIGNSMTEEIGGKMVTPRGYRGI